MNLFTLTINEKDYDVLDTIELNNKKYIIYKDSTNTYINEYTYNNQEISLLEIDEKTLEEVKKVINK